MTMNPTTKLMIRILKQRGRDPPTLDTGPTMTVQRGPATTAELIRIETRTRAPTTSPVKFLHVIRITNRMIITHATAVDKRIAKGIETMMRRRTVHRATTTTRNRKTAPYETIKMIKTNTAPPAIVAENEIQIATTLMIEIGTEIEKGGMSVLDALVAVSGQTTIERPAILRREALASETVQERKARLKLIATCPAPAVELRS